MDHINRLNWDSELFGYEIGEIKVSNIEEFNYRDFVKKSEKFKLVYVLSINKLKNVKLSLYDEKVIFYQRVRHVGSKEKSSSNFEISSVGTKKNTLKQLKELTLSSGIHSRFYLDPNFKNNEYQKLYLKWIENSINGNLAFDILIASNQAKILGFTTIGKKDNHLADIGLVAVDKNSRGLGIGTHLINEAIKTAGDAGFDEIQVVTQLRNTPAVKLYKKTGFEIKSIINIYHHWNL